MNNTLLNLRLEAKMWKMLFLDLPTDSVQTSETFNLKAQSSHEPVTPEK